MSDAPPVAGPLADPRYRRLFAAQVLSLVGTGLTTVALTLLAYDLEGGDAGVVLGIALGLKMVAYVGVAPLVAAFARRVDRRRLLVALDLLRALVVVAMTQVDAVWQVYGLIFVLSVCAAAFTPTFQALVPVVLPEEERYTRALSFSRVAYELEGLLSPALAAGLLALASYNVLFLGDGVTFVLSAALVASLTLPAPPATVERGRGWARVTRGLRHYVRVAELRGLLALNVAVAAGSALVVVDTVLFVRDELGRGAGDVAVALGAAGLGALLVALAIPKALRVLGERRVLLGGGGLLALALAATATGPHWTTLLALWFVIGAGLAAVQTPAGRLVARAVRADDGPELYAAQFALTHLCWLVTYPVAGILGSLAGLDAAAVVLAILAAGAVLVAATQLPAPGPRAEFGSS